MLAENRQESPSFTIAVLFPFGSRNEAPEIRGFVHCIEHMLFKGTSRHDAYSLWHLIERTGGFLNGFTERDAVCIYCSVPSPDWKLAVTILLEMAFGSMFPREEFDKEKQVIISEIRQVDDDIEETAYDAFLERYWTGNPASRKIAGGFEDVDALLYEEVVRLYRAAFLPGNAIIAVTGSFEEDCLAAAINSAIAEAEERPERQKPPMGRVGRALVPATTPEARVFDGYTKAPSSQIYYFDSFQLDPPFARNDYYGLGLISNILGEASTSRLFQRIREQQGLAYTIQSALAFTHTECLLTIQAVAGNNELPDCVRAIDDETAKLLAGGLDEGEIGDAKSRLAGGFLLALEDPEFRMRRMLRSFLTDGFVLDAEEERRMYLSIEPHDIGNLLKRLGSARRSRYAYGSIRAGTARKLAFQEM